MKNTTQTQEHVSNPSLFRKLLKEANKIKLWIVYTVSDLITGIDSGMDYGQDAKKLNPDNVIYQPLFIRYAKAVMDAFAITAQDKIFDYGCGKGVAMIFFAKYPFSEIGGIELMKRLFIIAGENFRKKGISNACAVHGDATAYQDIDRYTYFYFHNPFSGIVLQKVVAQIGESLRRAPRKITVLYHNPQQAHWFEQTGLFTYAKKCYVPRLFTVKPLPRQFINVYCTEEPSLNKPLDRYFI